MTATRTPKIPPRTREIDWPKVERHARHGLSAAQIATRLRLDPALAESEAFVEAVAYWRAVGLSEVAELLNGLAREGNLRAITFLLRAVGGWSETRGPNGEEQSGDGHGLEWGDFLLNIVPDGSPGDADSAE